MEKRGTEEGRKTRGRDQKEELAMYHGYPFSSLSHKSIDDKILNRTAKVAFYSKALAREINATKGEIERLQNEEEDQQEEEEDDDEIDEANGGSTHEATRSRIGVLGFVADFAKHVNERCRLLPYVLDEARETKIEPSLELRLLKLTIHRLRDANNDLHKLRQLPSHFFPRIVDQMDKSLTELLKSHPRLLCGSVLVGASVGALASVTWLSQVGVLGISLGAGIGAGIAVLLLVLYCKWRCPHDKRQQIAEIRLNKYLQTFLMEVKHNKDAFHDLCSELSDLGLIQEQAVSLPVSSTVVDIPEDAECCICEERYEKEGNHRACVLKCGHVFGRSCIEEWCHQQSVLHVPFSCPYCRQEFHITTSCPTD